MGPHDSIHGQEVTDFWDGDWRPAAPAASEVVPSTPAEIVPFDSVRSQVIDMRRAEVEQAFIDMNARSDANEL